MRRNGVAERSIVVVPLACIAGVLAGSRGWLGGPGRAPCPVGAGGPSGEFPPPPE